MRLLTSFFLFVLAAAPLRAEDRIEPAFHEDGIYTTSGAAEAGGSAGPQTPTGFQRVLSVVLVGPLALFGLLAVRPEEWRAGAGRRPGTSPEHHERAA
jgi:hypothetical protein